MTDSNSAEREAFEAWSTRVIKGASLKRALMTRMPSGQYADLYADHAWKAWQARAALSTQAAPQRSIEWPTMPPSKGQSHVLFDDGYSEGWAACLAACQQAVSAPVALTGEAIEDAVIELFTAAQGSSPIADRLGRIDEILCRVLASGSGTEHPDGAITPVDPVDAATPQPSDALRNAIRKLPMVRAREIDGEESDGTPISWRDRPYVSLTQLERLLAASPALQAPPSAPVALTIDELRAKWNSQADQFNQWDELGLDEIVHFAQTHSKQEGE